MIFLPFSVAHADEIVCPELSLVTTLPRNHADEVPVDLRPAVIYDGGACSSDEGGRLVLNVAGDGAFIPIAEQSYTVNTLNPVAELPLDSALEPLTRYRLDVINGDDVLVAAASFTTGEVQVNADLPAPDAPQIVSAWSYKGEEGFRVQAGGTVLVSEDPQELSLVRVALADDPSLTLDIAPLFTDQPVSFVANGVLDERTDTLCLVASRIDGAGREGEPSEPGCAELGKGDREGCATGPAAGPAALALAGLALLRRRTRP